MAHRRSRSPSRWGEEFEEEEGEDEYENEAHDDDAAFENAALDVGAQALIAAQHPLPPGRGILKSLVMKRPAARGLAPTADSVALGRIKLMLCRDKSYVLAFNPATKKWPLVVEAKCAYHHEIAQELFRRAQHEALDKAAMIELRTKLETEGVHDNSAYGPSCAECADDSSAEDSNEDWRHDFFSS